MVSRDTIRTIASWLACGALVAGVGYSIVRETPGYRTDQARRETALLIASDVVDRNHNYLLEPEEKLDAFMRLGYDTRRFDVRNIPDISILDTEQLEKLVVRYKADGIYPNYGSW